MSPEPDEPQTSVPAHGVRSPWEDTLGRDPLEGLALHCLVGPTAAGKSALALAIAERAGAEIVSLDSMQVYKGMDIGTAKPTAEERARVPHHLLDLVEPPVRYDVHQYLTDLRALLFLLSGSERRLLFVGGTAFYLKVLVHGLFDGPPADLELRSRLTQRLKEQGNERLHAELTRVDPVSAQRIHPNDSKRLVRALEVLEQTGKPLSEWQTQWSGEEERATRARHRLVGIDVPPEDLDRRIRARTTQMIDAGWPDECVAIRDGAGFGPTSVQALGYAQVLDFCEGRSTREQCEELVSLRTRQFARRQRTWYRKFDIDWLYTSGRGVSEHHVADALRRFGWEV